MKGGKDLPRSSLTIKLLLGHCLLRVTQDGTCALERPELQCEQGVGEMKGTWKRVTDFGLYALLGCPTGHLLNNETAHDVQACIRCEEGKYMADPNNPDIACETCPRGRSVSEDIVGSWQCVQRRLRRRTAALRCLYFALAISLRLSTHSDLPG